MLPLKDIPIQRKITLVILVTCTLAVLIAGMAVLGVQLLVFQQQAAGLEQQGVLTGLAGLISRVILITI